MSELPKGFIHIKRAGKRFKTSRSTLDRRRDRAREEADEKTYRAFLLKTKDGELIRTPSKQRVDELIKTGKVPEWYVSTAWLEQEYGRRQPNSSPPSTVGESRPPGVELASALKSQYEERIRDLKDQLAVEREEKRDLLKYAQADKQMFAKAAESLTQVLALPGIAEATKAQQPKSSVTELIKGSSADPAPTASQRGESEASDAIKLQRQHWWGRLVRRRS